VWTQTVSGTEFSGTGLYSEAASDFIDMSGFYPDQTIVKDHVPSSSSMDDSAYASQANTGRPTKSSRRSSESLAFSPAMVQDMGSLTSEGPGCFPTQEGIIPFTYHPESEAAGISGSMGAPAVFRDNASHGMLRQPSGYSANQMPLESSFTGFRHGRTGSMSLASPALTHVGRRQVAPMSMEQHAFQPQQDYVQMYGNAAPAFQHGFLAYGQASSQTQSDPSFYTIPTPSSMGPHMSPFIESSYFDEYTDYNVHM